MAMRGRPAFQPTDEQRKNVEVMVGLGITEENICLLVRDRRDKPISRNSLRKHFKKQLETGATKLNAQVGNFMVSTIFGAKPPNGMTPIRDERVRGRLGELFLKARLGWREIDLGSKRERRAERARNSAEPWEAQLKAHKDAERSLDAKLARLARSIKAGETGGSSAG
jgi:hypothetical protein